MWQIYSRIRLFQSHSDQKRTSNYSKFELSEYIEKESLKKCGWQIKNIAQVCRRMGVGLTPFSLVALLQTLACNVGGHTYIHTHTPESLATWSIALIVLCFTSLEKCFHCDRMPKSLWINRILTSKFQQTNIFVIKLK